MTKKQMKARVKKYKKANKKLVKEINVSTIKLNGIGSILDMTDKETMKHYR